MQVDSDSRNPIQSGTHESSSSSTHVGLLSASNAGAGYTAFACVSNLNTKYFLFI